MKTTLVLIIAAVAGMSFAGPSDSAAFAIRAANEAAARNDAANRVALVRGAESQGCCAAAKTHRCSCKYSTRRGGRCPANLVKAIIRGVPLDDCLFVEAEVPRRSAAYRDSCSRNNSL